MPVKIDPFMTFSYPFQLALVVPPSTPSHLSVPDALQREGVGGAEGILGHYGLIHTLLSQLLLSLTPHIPPPLPLVHEH